MQTRRCFVAGATGAVGRTLLPLADAKGVEIVAHVRPQSASRLGARVVVALDLKDPSLPEKMKGCTTVIQLIGTMKKRFSSGDTYETSDIGTTRSLVDAAKACGTVDHVVLLSSVGAGSPTGAYLKAKAEAERIVVESGIPYTLVRPSAFEDREGVWVPGMRAITSFLGLERYQPIKLKELAGAILHVAAQRAPLSGVLEGKSLWEAVKAGT